MSEWKFPACKPLSPETVEAMRRLIRESPQAHMAFCACDPDEVRGLMGVIRLAPADVKL